MRLHFFCERLKNNIYWAKRLYFVWFFIGISMHIYAQNNDKWRAGSANALKGKVYVLSVFIATEDNDWTNEEKLEVFKLQREACSWLQTQAKKYQEVVTFQEGTFGFKETMFFDEIASGSGSGNEATDWIGHVLRKAGYKKNMDFYNWVKKNTTCTQAIVLVYAHQNGISYALPFSNEMDQEDYFNEGCLIYQYYDEAKQKPLCAATIAHEILHTFGTWDLYATFQQSSDREKKARQIYANDIMLRVSYTINDLAIGGLTAWLVGWRVKEEKGFNWFRPKGY